MRDPIHNIKGEDSEISVAFSPCPNDTFMMDALVHDKIDHPYKIKTKFLDIQGLNEAAMQSIHDITKVSAAVLPFILDEYQLLESGAAMGFGVGPILVSKKDIEKERLNHLTTAIPGKNTTAHYLFSHFYPNSNHKIFIPFNEIEAAIFNGSADAGVLIHEGRFTFQSKGLQLIQDLGSLWEDQYHLPIPLGVLIAKKSLGKSSIDRFDKALSESIQYAFKYPDESHDYVLAHAQEMSPEVVRQHIDLYVNEFSIQMGHQGHQALDFLLSKNLQLF